MAVKGSMQAPALLRLREPEVRELCGGAASGRGDAWQRAGHVGSPTVYTDGLSADVRGTWRQVERVTASADARGIHTTCTCGAGEYCRHAAALLLQWIRAPRTFADLTPDLYGDPPSLEEALALADEFPESEPQTSELADLLETHTMTKLREIARLRGLRGGGRNKTELAATLAVSLAEPTNLDAALATLTADEIALLQVLDLVDSDVDVSTVVAPAYRALSGQTEFYVALATLVDLGLVFDTGDWNYQPQQYVVPRVVSARLPLSDTLLWRLVSGAEGSAGTTSREDSAGLDLIEVMIVVVHEILRGHIGREIPAVPEGATITEASGWMVEPVLGAGSRVLAAPPRGTELTLHPQPPFLLDSDLRSLMERTGCSRELIVSAVDMLLVMNVLTPVRRGRDTQLVAQQRMLSALLSLPPAMKIGVLTEAWLTLFEAVDFRTVSIGGRPVELHTRHQPYHPLLPTGGPRSGAVRSLMARLVGRLAAGESEARWYDLPAWLDMLWTLVPALLGTGTGPSSEWWFRSASERDPRVNLEDRAGWQEIWEPLVESMLVGPMTWLHLVDTGLHGDGTLSFRPRPEAAVLSGKAIDEVERRSLLPLTLRVDSAGGVPEVLVPARYPDASLHAMLARDAELSDVSPSGIRYRLTRQRAQEAFDAGEAVPDLLRVLEERAGGSVTDEVRDVLNAWWSSYGHVRLYDDLTLIELDDDILLHELLATSSLRTWLVDVITPRLVAVDPAGVRTLLGEMERIGHTPRVLDDA